MEEPKAPSEARRREAPERRGGGVWGPPQFQGLGAFRPREKFKFNVQIYAFNAIFALNSTLNLMTSFP